MSVATGPGSLTTRRLRPEVIGSLPGAALGAFLILAWSRPSPEGRLFTLFDDAAISLTYARTFARTGELVWFPGADRVEGISNLAWTMVLALVHAAGLEGSSASLAVACIGLLLLIAHSILVGRLVATVHPDRPVSSAVAAAVAGLAYPLLFWTLRGFETGLIAVLSAGSVLLAASSALEPERTGQRALIGAAGLTLLAGSIRLDAIVVPFVASAFIAVRGRTSRRSTITAAAVVMTGLAALVAWRLTYFGVPVPNTYDLKVDGTPLLWRAARGLAVSGWNIAIGLVVAAAAAAAFLSARSGDSTDHRRAEVVGLAATAFIGLVAYAVIVGGDAWEWSGLTNRFVSPGLGLAVAVIVAGGAPPVGRFLRSLLTEEVSTPAAGPVPQLGGPGRSLVRRSRPLAVLSGSLLVAALLGGPAIGVLAEETAFAQLVRDATGRGMNAGPADWVAWFTRSLRAP